MPNANVLRTVRTFERQMRDEQETWPAELVASGHRALLSLNMIAHNNPKTIEAIKKNAPSVWTSIATDIDTFNNDYAVYRTTCSPVPDLHGRSVSPAEAPAGTV